MSGHLCFEIREAYLEKDVNMLLEMCPNYVVTFHGHSVKGPKAYGGGKNPKWTDFDTIDHAIKANVNWGGFVKVRFNNESEFICETKIHIEDLVKHNQKERQYSLFRENKPCGHFFMKADYKGPPL